MIGFVTGLRAEAELLLASGHRVEWAGGDPAAAARRLIQSGARGLVSFGVAGGLHPSLQAGDLVIALSVTAEDGRLFLADTRLACWLIRHSPRSRKGGIAGVSHPIASPADKAELNLRTRALAVDMESAAVAEVAQAHRLPFAALRAISDPANLTIPAQAVAAFQADGRVSPLAVLGGVLAHPADMALLARGYVRAMARLRRVTLRLPNAVEDYSAAGV